MKAQKSASDIMRGLERHHLTFRTFTVSSEGAWSAEDADWNYKDVPHLNVVHSLAWTVPAAIGDEIIVTVNIQKMLGWPMPIALANYVAADGTQVYFTTMLFFVLIVETRIVQDSADRLWCRVETTYRIGGPRVAMLLFPVLRRLLEANYRVLMSEDLPMREQRGRLRRAGYTFRSDGRPRTFAETTELWTPNVVPGASANGGAATMPLSELSAPGAKATLGAAPGGYVVVRGDDFDVSIFDRVCDHEGADLVGAEVAKSCLVCPWHAKRVRPVATFDLRDTTPRLLWGGEHEEIRLDEGMVVLHGRLADE